MFTGKWDLSEWRWGKGIGFKTGGRNVSGVGAEKRKPELLGYITEGTMRGGPWGEIGLPHVCHDHRSDGVPGIEGGNSGEKKTKAFQHSTALG